MKLSGHAAWEMIHRGEIEENLISNHFVEFFQDFRGPVFKEGSGSCDV